MAQTHLHSESSLSSSWQTRLHYWEATLARDPDSPVAWRWRIQIKILRFLLSRYDGFEEEPTPASSPTGITFFDIPAPPARPKSDLTIRRSLFHVAKINGLKPQKVYKPGELQNSVAIQKSAESPEEPILPFEVAEAPNPSLDSCVASWAALVENPHLPRGIYLLLQWLTFGLGVFFFLFIVGMFLHLIYLSLLA